jgi:GNAT superfamily N-acetyltransferase
LSARLDIAREPYDSPDALALARAQRDELLARYGNHGSGGEPEAEEFSESGAFLVVRLESRPVACGGVRRLADGVAEIKRMYVVPDGRGRGIGRTLLAALEREASDAGLPCVRLETGCRQPEAIALYERAGYRRIPPYGPFVDDPDSVCFEKTLS